jgi:hypothetical protein
MPVRPSHCPPDPDHLRAVLARSPLFGPLPEAVRDEVARRMTWNYLPGGEALLRPGDASRWLYLVVHGRLRVYMARRARCPRPSTRSRRCRADRSSPPTRR